jgi:hypothetical protein
MRANDESQRQETASHERQQDRSTVRGKQLKEQFRQHQSNQTTEQFIAKKFKNVIEEATIVFMAYMDGYASCHDKEADAQVVEKYPQFKARYEPDPDRVAKYYDLDRLDSLFSGTANGNSVIDVVVNHIDDASDGYDDIGELIQDAIKEKIKAYFGISDVVAILPGAGL